MSGHHEPCGREEVWVGNTPTHDPHFTWLQSQLATARLGEVAYDVHGRALPPSEGYAPIFIHRTEEQRHHEIMMKKTFGPHWRRG